MSTLDAKPEPGETYYREHGWSGCAGSAWSTLTDATKDGWRHAERLADQQANPQGSLTRDAFVVVLHHAMVEDEFRQRPDGFDIHPAYLAEDSDARARADRIVTRLHPVIAPLLTDSDPASDKD
jgi:hypothetical protein